MSRILTRAGGSGQVDLAALAYPRLVRRDLELSAPRDKDIQHRRQIFDGPALDQREWRLHLFPKSFGQDFCFPYPPLVASHLGLCLSPTVPPTHKGRSLPLSYVVVGEVQTPQGRPDEAIAKGNLSAGYEQQLSFHVVDTQELEMPILLKKIRF